MRAGVLGAWRHLPCRSCCSRSIYNWALDYFGSNLVFECEQVYLVPGDTFRAATAAQEAFTIGLWTILTQTSSLDARRCTWCLVTPSELQLPSNWQSGQSVLTSLWARSKIKPSRRKSLHRRVVVLSRVRMCLCVCVHAQLRACLWGKFQQRINGYNGYNGG
jgi:hypothetical protein